MRASSSALGIGTLLLAGCVSSSFNLATHQLDYTITSTAKEVELGRAIAQKVEARFPVLADETVQNRVRAIGGRIAAVCERQEVVYHFAVLDDETVNAFSLPGGYVYVHRGLIEQTGSDDELAGVIAHEVAHIAARHAVKRLEGHLGAQLASLAALVTRQGEASQGVNVALQAAQLAYARQDELKADRLAVRYLQVAGFDPTAMLTFLETLHRLPPEGKTPRYLPRGVVRPQYALTHPFVPERLRAVKEALFGVADYVDYLNTPD